MRDAEPGSIFVITAYELRGQTACGLSPAAEEQTAMKRSRNRFPSGWNEARVRRVLEHYEQQSEEEAVAEDEAAFLARGQTVMIVPKRLVPENPRLIQRRASRAPEKSATSRHRG